MVPQALQGLHHGAPVVAGKAKQAQERHPHQTEQQQHLGAQGAAQRIDAQGIAPGDRVGECLDGCHDPGLGVPIAPVMKQVGGQSRIGRRAHRVGSFGIRKKAFQGRKRLALQRPQRVGLRLAFPQQGELLVLHSFTLHQGAQRDSLLQRHHGSLANPGQMPVGGWVVLRAGASAIADVQNFEVALLEHRVRRGDVAARHAGQVFGALHQFLGQFLGTPTVLLAGGYQSLGLQQPPNHRAHGQHHEHTQAHHQPTELANPHAVALAMNTVSTPV
jgi:hypothetical protein